MQGAGRDWMFLCRESCGLDAGMWVGGWNAHNTFASRLQVRPVCIWRGWRFKLLPWSYLFFREWERGKGEKRGKETSMWESNIDWLPLIHTLIGEQSYNPGMWPDWELNQWPFALQDNAQPTEPHQSGLNCCPDLDDKKRPLACGRWTSKAHCGEHRVGNVECLTSALEAQLTPYHMPCECCQRTWPNSSPLRWQAEHYLFYLLKAGVCHAVRGHNSKSTMTGIVNITPSPVSLALWEATEHCDYEHHDQDSNVSPAFAIFVCAWG